MNKKEISAEMETVRKNKMEMLRNKGKNNSWKFNRFISRFNRGEKIFSKSEDRSKEITQMETQR